MKLEMDIGNMNGNRALAVLHADTWKVPLRLARSTVVWFNSMFTFCLKKSRLFLIDVKQKANFLIFV